MTFTKQHHKMLLCCIVPLAACWKNYNKRLRVKKQWTVKQVGEDSKTWYKASAKKKKSYKCLLALTALTCCTDHHNKIKKQNITPGLFKMLTCKSPE